MWDPIEVVFWINIESTMMMTMIMNDKKNNCKSKPNRGKFEGKEKITVEIRGDKLA